jgi:hypothetical protein
MRSDEPAVLHRRRRTIDPSAYDKRHAQESDYATLITEPTLLYDEDTQAVTLAYLPVERDTAALVGVLRRLKIDHSVRKGGLESFSRTFGYHPRDPLRNNWCSPSSLATEDPEAHALLVSYAGVVTEAYRRANPALLERHTQLARAVREEWMLEGGPFTSVIEIRDRYAGMQRLDCFARIISDILVELEDAMELRFPENEHVVAVAKAVDVLLEQESRLANVVIVAIAASTESDTSTPLKFEGIAVETEAMDRYPTFWANGDDAVSEALHKVFAVSEDLQRERIGQHLNSTANAGLGREIEALYFVRLLRRAGIVLANLVPGVEAIQYGDQIRCDYFAESLLGLGTQFQLLVANDWGQLLCSRLLGAEGHADRIGPIAE